jgi:hypothetical protein
MPNSCKEVAEWLEISTLSFHSQSDAEVTTAISRRGVAGAMLVERATKRSPAAGRLFAQRERIRLWDGMTLK